MKDDKKPSILLLDDNEDILSLMAEGLRFGSFRVVTAADGLEGERKFKNEKFDLIITDLSMPKVDGVTFVQRAREVHFGIPVMVISGNMDEFRPRLALIDNISYLEKPFEIKKLVEVAKSILTPTKVVSENSKGKKLQLVPGGVLMNEGDEGTSMYWVISGSLCVYKKLDGKEVELGMISDGELVGEMSFLDSQPRSATVKAVTECELLEIPNGKFAEVLNAQPKWFKSLVRTLSERIRATNEKIDV